MPDSSSRSQARLLAPAALAAAVVAVVAVFAGSTGGGSGSSQSTATQTSTSKRTTRTTPAKKKATTYTVKVGDSLGTIAQKTGLTVERLQTLNPAVDPQALVAGQKLKLAE